MDRTLLDYLPPVLRNVMEVQAINEANEPEISLAWDVLSAVLANQFLETADAQGVAIWEKELKIFSKDTDSLAERKARIKAMWNLELPYTLSWLREWLTSICGPGNCAVNILKESYTLLVKIRLSAKSNFDTIQALLERVTPENLVIHLSQLYNTYAELGTFTHTQLAAHSHHDLRNEVLKNG